MDSNLKKSTESKGRARRNMCYLMGREIFCRCFEKAKVLTSEDKLIRGWKNILAEKLADTKSNGGFTGPVYIVDRFNDVRKAIDLNRFYDNWGPYAEEFTPLIEYAGFADDYDQENERLKTLELPDSVKRRLSGFLCIDNLLADAHVSDAPPVEIRALCTSKPLGILAFPSEVIIKNFPDGKSNWDGKPALNLSPQQIKSVVRYEMTNNEITSWIKLDYLVENQHHCVYLTEVGEELIDNEFYHGIGCDHLLSHFEKMLELKKISQ